ncbi:MAG: PAS domain-containing sensor histidine kinase [Fusobacteriota bacterium]
MKLKEKSKDELIKLIHEKNELIETLFNESKNQEQLKFAWTNNLGRWYWNVKNNTVKHNPLKVEALGYRVKEVGEVGYQFFTEKLHPDDYDRVMKKMEEHLKGETDAYEVEYRIRTKNGNWKWYYDRGATTKRDMNGNPVLVAGIVFDITERKKMEKEIKEKNQELKALNEKKNSFIGMAAHDLRGPTGSVLGVVRFLESELQGDITEDVKELLELATASLNHMLRLIDDFLDISKIESGELNLKCKKIKYIRFMEKIVKMGKSLAKNKKIDIELKTKDIDNIKINLDKGKIRQVLMNFIGNAIKYSEEKTKITINIYKENNYIITSVEDQGPGLDEKDKTKLFKPFGTTKNQPVGEEKSTGLGLYISKMIIDRHDGKIGVISQKGEGAAFYFKLPILE